ncbi:MAG: glycosyltransferase family 4 protein [Caldilineaceae bacterium]|nr:glycosyltransferase family 4 protein [Caldilineaceae bacterium]
MRILQLVQKSQRRGAEVFAYQQSAAMRTLGHTVQTAYLYPYSGQKALELKSGDYALNGNETHWQEKVPGIHSSLLWKLRRAILEFQPHVVQVNGARTVKYGALARMSCPRRPWVLIYRNIGNPLDWVRSRQLRICYRRLVMPQLDGVVGVSVKTLNTVKTFYHLTVPLACILNGIEINDPGRLARGQLRRELATPEEAPVVLFVGSLSPEKRVDRLLRAAQGVHRQIPNLHLWIVGDGPQRQQVQAQAEAAGLAHNVRFTGIREDVTSIMAAADLFVLTSDTEGIPATILEAGAQGLPVVATKVGGIPECVIENETGLLVDPEAEAELASSILKLLHNPALRLAMGARAAQWVRANFEIEKIAQQYLAFYEQVIAYRRMPKPF